MTKRRERKLLAKWENDTRHWAFETARDLVMNLVHGQAGPAAPYGIGVVLDPGEQVWAECPLRFHQEGGYSFDVEPPVRPWLITSDRVVGRLADDQLYGWRWDQVRGCLVDLSTDAEFVALDLDGCVRLAWTGPGVAPLAVATVHRLHGPLALAEHPGLQVLRVRVPTASATGRAIGG